MGCVVKCNPNPQTKFSYMRVHPSARQLCIDFDERRIHDRRIRQVYFVGDNVFYQHNQRNVSNAVLSGVVDELLNGCNCLILAYGGRGCGKTFSCFGLNGEYDDRGVALHLLQDLFSVKATKKKTAEITFEMSFMEFKQNCAIDLLSKETFIDLKRHKMTDIGSAHAAVQLIFAGGANRDKKVIKGCESHYNSAVLTIRMHYRSLMKQSPVVVTSDVQIVDLAAVEIGKNNIKTAILMENINGNIAMMQISYVIDSLIKNKNAVLSYRSPLLTHLKCTLGQHSLMKFIGHTRGSMNDMPTLKTICRISMKLMQTPQSLLKYNVDRDPKQSVEYLENQVKSLTHQMLRNEMILKQEQEIFTNNERIAQMKLKIEEYLEDRQTDLGVLSVTKARTALNMCKELINKLKAENVDLKHKLEEATKRQEVATSSLGKVRDSMSQNVTSKSTRASKMSIGKILPGKGITVGDSENRKPSKRSKKPPHQPPPAKSVSPPAIAETTSEEDVSQKTGHLKDLNLDDLDYDKSEQIQERIKSLMNTVQREYLCTLVNLRQAQTELLVLRQNIKLEGAKDEARVRGTALNEFADTINVHEARIKQYESSLKNIQTSIDDVSQLAEKVACKQPGHYLKVYKPPGSVSNQDTRCRNEYQLCKELYLRDRRK